MPHVDDLLGIAALATLGWTAALVAEPALEAGVAAIASAATSAIAAAAGNDVPDAPLASPAHAPRPR